MRVRSLTASSVCPISWILMCAEQVPPQNPTRPERNTDTVAPWWSKRPLQKIAMRCAHVHASHIHIAEERRLGRPAGVQATHSTTHAWHRVPRRYRFVAHPLPFYPDREEIALTGTLSALPIRQVCVDFDEHGGKRSRALWRHASPWSQRP
jgi:hypothetical protein